MNDWYTILMIWFLAGSCTGIGGIVAWITWLNSKVKYDGSFRDIRYKASRLSLYSFFCFFFFFLIAFLKGIPIL